MRSWGWGAAGGSVKAVPVTYGQGELVHITILSLNVLAV
jgi:hypothetical protein